MGESVDELDEDGGEVEVGEGEGLFRFEEGLKVTVGEVIEDEDLEGAVEDSSVEGDDGGMGGDASVEG